MKLYFTKNDLIEALFSRNSKLVPVETDSRRTFYLAVSAVEREDGSGRSFNVKGTICTSEDGLIPLSIIRKGIFHVVTR